MYEEEMGVRGGVGGGGEGKLNTGVGKIAQLGINIKTRPTRTIEAQLSKKNHLKFKNPHRYRALSFY